MLLITVMVMSPLIVNFMEGIIYNSFFLSFFLKVVMSHRNTMQNTSSDSKMRLGFFLSLSESSDHDSERRLVNADLQLRSRGAKKLLFSRAFLGGLFIL